MICPHMNLQVGLLLERSVTVDTRVYYLFGSGGRGSGVAICYVYSVAAHMYTHVGYEGGFVFERGRTEHTREGPRLVGRPLRAPLALVGNDDFGFVLFTKNRGHVLFDSQFVPMTVLTIVFQLN
uniref:Uncharacterized protein n=1 Tax=Cacopsylla melanoneura TaxID=428564 RepID=A0A8D8SA44_9HEMI